jgi:lysophospholipase L1-like esterase
MLADDLRPWLRQQRPTVVIFALGNNDYGIRRTRLYRPRLEWALRQVPRRAEVIWYGPTSVTPGDNEHLQDVARNHNRVAEMQEEVFADSPVTWVDTRPISAGYNRADGYHLVRRGYSAWATHLVNLVVGAP